MRSLFIVLVSSVSCLSIAPAFSQSIPDAGSLQNQQQRQETRLPDRLPDVDRPAERQELKGAGGARIQIERITYSGATYLADATELQNIVADAIGKQLDFSDLENLTGRVTAFLKGKGWFLARAYLPRQDLTAGALDITILAGHLDGSKDGGTAFTVETDRNSKVRINSGKLNQIAGNHLPAGDTAREEGIERAVLLMNDLPGVSARASLEPGSTADSTHVVIAVKEGPLFTGSTWIDNYGSLDTGETQANIAAQVNDLSGIGDQISVLGTYTEGLGLLRLGYSVPLGSNGLKVNAAATGMTYRIIRGTGKTSGLEGNSSTSNVGLSYPFIRSRSANFYGMLGYAGKSLKDDSSTGNLHDKYLANWNAGFSGDLLDAFGGGGITSTSVSWTSGRLDLSRNSADATADAAAYASQGDFNKLVYSINRLQKLPSAWTLFANVSGQTSNSNLDSSEKFILGGPYGVRAYSGGEGMGDSGWLANFELRYDLPGGTPWGNVQFVTFADSGRITQHADSKGLTIATATGLNSYSLSGWGVGINLTKTASHAVHLLWASKIGDNPGRSVSGLDADSRNADSRFWLQATIWF